jgi:hypothetical protein
VLHPVITKTLETARRDATRWRIPGLTAVSLSALILAIVCSYFWLVTYGTWSLRASEVKGVAFDSLAKHLLSFDASVDSDAIGFEGLTVGARTVMYWGAFPALLRIVPNLLLPSMYGLWSRPSCLLAALLALAAAVATSRAALAAAGQGWTGRILYLLTATVGFGLGTPLVYLLSCGRIYHESILWGLCGSFCSIYFIILLLNRQIAARRGLFGLSVSFAVTLLTRTTFAIPIALAMSLLTIQVFGGVRATSKVRAARVKVAVQLVLVLTPAVIGGAFHFWYNYNRFGSILDNTHIAGYMHPADFGGVFNLQRIPSALYNYFGLTTTSLSSHPPFFKLARVRYADDTLFFNWKEETLSLSLGSSWLLLGAALGVVTLVRSPRSASAIFITLCFVVQVFFISAFDFVTERFAAEYLPFLAYLFALHLRATAGSVPAGRALPLLLLALASLSAVATVGSALQWNQAVNVDVPLEYKVRLADLLYRDGSAPADRGTPVQLSDLVPLSEAGVPFAMRKNSTWDGLPLVLKGLRYRSGLGMHANGRATFAVPAGALTFWALAGIPDSTIRCPNGTVVFELFDQSDRLLYRSRTMRTGENPEQVEVPLEGVERLSLVVDDAGDGTDCDQAAWGVPVFISGPASSASR